MLVFLIPLKSAKVSSSWKLVSSLFERCLRSVCNQTSSEFRAIVVCHERPDIEFNHSCVSYLDVDFPIPTITSNTDMSSRDIDKSRKIYQGLIYARSFQPSHVMLVDADDCVSKHLTHFVRQNPESNGWFLRHGYEYQDGSERILYRRKNFHRKCGTSYIVKYPLLNALVESMPFDDIKERNFLYHQDIAGQMEKQGNPLAVLPLIGAVKVTDNGENVCDRQSILLEMLHRSPRKIFFFYIRRLLKSLVYQPLTPAIREEFGLYDLTLSPARDTVNQYQELSPRRTYDRESILE